MRVHLELTCNAKYVTINPLYCPIAVSGSTLTGGIPFSLSLPKAPAALNADTMTDDQLHAALQVGIKEIQNGDTVDAASAFAQFREQHR